MLHHNMINNFTPIKIAKKRALSMGVAHDEPPRSELIKHKFAIYFLNVLGIIEDMCSLQQCVVSPIQFMPDGKFKTELRIRIKDCFDDYVYFLYEIGQMATHINAWCDTQKVKDDKIAEYYLYKFSQYCDVVCNSDKLG